MLRTFHVDATLNRKYIRRVNSSLQATPRNNSSYLSGIQSLKQAEPMEIAQTKNQHGKTTKMKVTAPLTNNSRAIATLFNKKPPKQQAITK